MKKRLGDYIKEYSVRNKNGDDIPVYSVTNAQGFCKDYFGKEVSSKDKSTYKIVPKGCFAYNPSRINVGSVDWQRHEDKVIVSPLYNVFSVVPRLNQQYLYYYLKSEFALQRIRAVATGSVRDNLKLAMLYEFPISIPDLKQQQGIVGRLDRVRQLISLRKQELEILDRLIKARFVEMFGDPALNPMGWEQTTLKDVAVGKLSYGSGASAIQYDGNLRYVRITDITDNGDLNNDKKTPDSFDDKYLLHTGDVLFARSGATVGKTICYDENKHGRAIYAGYLIRMVPDKNKVLPLYVFNYTKTSYYANFVETAQRAVAQPNINAKEYGDLLICVPPIALQEQFVTFVNQVDKSKVVQ